MPQYGTLNIHPSLLPRWRGASPVQRSLEAGDNQVGVSILFTVSKMDAGPIVTQNRCQVDENETATTLLPLLFKIGTQMLIEVLPKVLEGKINMENSMQQDERGVVNANMIDSSEGELFLWRESARKCHNKIRGFSIWPGTFIYICIGDIDLTNLVKLKIISTRVLDIGPLEPTNEIILGPCKGDGLRVVCGDGSVLEFLEVQPVTKKIMDAKSFANGLQGRKVHWIRTPVKDSVTFVT